MSAVEKTVTLGSGKKLSVREITPSRMLKLLAVEDAASTPGWVRYALSICSVTAIDDVPVPFPETADEIEQLADRIGNEGVIAMSKVVWDEKDEQAKN